MVETNILASCRPWKDNRMGCCRGHRPTTPDHNRATICLDVICWWMGRFSDDARGQPWLEYAHHCFPIKIKSHWPSLHTANPPQRYASHANTTINSGMRSRLQVPIDYNTREAAMTVECNYNIVFIQMLRYSQHCINIDNPKMWTTTNHCQNTTWQYVKQVNNNLWQWQQPVHNGSR